VVVVVVVVVEAAVCLEMCKLYALGTGYCVQSL